MSEFTKGPWFIRYSENAWSIFPFPDVQRVLTDDEYTQQIVSNVCGFYWKGTKQEANANLISAAPELYEALESVLALFENQDHEPDLKEVYAVTVSKIEAAMSKARGECD